MDLIIQLVLNGLLAGALYAVIALGLSLVFGIIMKITILALSNRSFSNGLIIDGSLILSRPIWLDFPQNNGLTCVATAIHQ